MSGRRTNKWPKPLVGDCVSNVRNASGSKTLRERMTSRHSGRAHKSLRFHQPQRPHTSMSGGRDLDGHTPAVPLRPATSMSGAHFSLEHSPEPPPHSARGPHAADQGPASREDSRYTRRLIQSSMLKVRDILEAFNAGVSTAPTVVADDTRAASEGGHDVFVCDLAEERLKNVDACVDAVMEQQQCLPQEAQLEPGASEDVETLLRKPNPFDPPLGNMDPTMGDLHEVDCFSPDPKDGLLDFAPDDGAKYDSGDARVLFNLVHRTLSRLEVVDRYCQILVARGILQDKHEMVTECSAAIEGLRGIRSSVNDIVADADSTNEELQRHKHKLWVLQERDKCTDVTVNVHRLASLQLKTVVRWQKHVMWRQRIARNRERAARKDNVSRPASTKSTNFNASVVMIAMEHGGEQVAIDPSTHILLDGLVTTSARFANASVAIQGVGAAAKKGYYCLLFDTETEAVTYALQLQYAAMRVPWSAKTVVAKHSLPVLDSQIDQASMPGKEVAFYQQHVLSSVKGSYTAFDSTRFSHIAENLQSRSDTDRAPIPFSEEHVFYGPRLRMAVHSGLVLRDGGYYGEALMKTSELCGKARAGEVLLSEEVHKTVGAFLTPESVFVHPRHLAVPDDLSVLNWREAGRSTGVNLFRSDERAFSCFCKEHAARHAVLPEVTDMYEHERVLYNPNWHLRFCNLPPEYWADELGGT